MAISVGALVVIGILLALTFVVLLCVGNSSSIVETVSKRLGIGSNDPEKEFSKGMHSESGFGKADKQGNANEHIQMAVDVNDRYTDAPTTTPTKDGDDDDDSDPKLDYDYPTPKPPKAIKREVPIPEELKKIAQEDKNLNRAGDDTVEKGEKRQIDHLPAYVNAKIGQPKPMPRKIVQPKTSEKEDDDDDKDQVYQNVSTGK